MIFYVIFLICLTNKLIKVISQEKYDRAPLKEIAQFRLQPRFAEGKLCAAAFLQDNFVYTDCTDAPNPNNESGREWCWFQFQLAKENERNWGYCSPVVDYNLIRAKANQVFQTKSNEIQKIVDRLDNERLRLNDLITRYHATCGADLDALKIQVDKLDNLLDGTDRSLELIKNSMSKIDSLKKEIQFVANNIRSEQTKALKNPHNCYGIPAYEDSVAADGLKGSYYKNIYLKGTPIVRIDDQINFIWSSTQPIKGISKEGFSVRWSGFIEVPYTSDYTFILETACAGRVILNNDAIILDRMSHPKDSDDITKQILPPTSHDGLREVSSASISLTGGIKIPIIVEMVHSTHLRYKDPDEAIIKLSWKASSIQQEVIPKSVFYRSNSKPPLKISGLKPDLYDITYLYDGEYAYKNDKNHYIVDTPHRYLGAKTIRTFKDLKENSVSFEVNAASTLYFASPMVEEVPFRFHQIPVILTKDILSVYEADSREARAKDAKYFSIYTTQIPAAGIYTMNLQSLKFPFIAFIIPNKSYEGVCGGPSLNLSAPNSPVNSSCEASSSLSPEYTCEYGLSTVNADQPYGIWKTKGGNGVGQYLIIRFKKMVNLEEFIYKPLDDAIYWPEEITLYFSENSNDTSSQRFRLVYSSNIDNLKYRLNPVMTKYVKIVITRMYDNGQDSGGSFEFYGTQCNEKLIDITKDNKLMKNKTEASTNTHSFTVIKDCKETLQTIQTENPISVGQSIFISCPVKCFEEIRATHSIANDFIADVSISFNTLNNNHQNKIPVNIRNVFGADSYAFESELCPVAMHLGICNTLNTIELPDSNTCDLVVEIQDGRETYTGELRHNIQSLPHGPSKLSFTMYSKSPEREEIDTNEQIYFISFRSADSTNIPQGYFIDDGSPIDTKKSFTGIRYGWYQTAKIVHCNEVENSRLNPLHQSGIKFPPSPHSIFCANTDCAHNFWTLELPSNGHYQIEAQIGNPCSPSEGKYSYYLQVNGIPLADNIELEKNKFYWATESFNVIDKKIILTATCNEQNENSHYCDKALTTIMNIRLTRLSNKSIKI